MSNMFPEMKQQCNTTENRTRLFSHMVNGYK